MKRLISRFTMIEIEHSYFRDAVNGKTVKLYVDCYGQKWMAYGKWGYRVKSENVITK